MVGPLDDHVYGLRAVPRRAPYSAFAMVGDTSAATLMMQEEVPPGAPAVVRAGPLLPALR